METVTEKRIYISADYDPTSGDHDVVEKLERLAKDQRYKVEFKDMAAAKSGSVSDNEDCRVCDLKEEFNRKINISSIVVFIVGYKTKDRDAGSTCKLASNPLFSIFSMFPINNIECTPYKRNASGSVYCKKTASDVCDDNASEDVCCINNFSFLQHEFEQAKHKQAKHKGKKIVIIYNSSRKEEKWLPSYMREYIAEKEKEEIKEEIKEGILSSCLPSYSKKEKDFFVITFYKKQADLSIVVNYPSIKEALGFN